MKKTYKLISVLLVSIMLFCSCSTEVVIPKTELQTSAPTPIPMRVQDLGKMIYFWAVPDMVGDAIDDLYNSPDVLDYNRKSTTLFNELLMSRNVVEETVEKKKTWNFYGNVFNLDYQFSNVYTDSAPDGTYIDYYSDSSNNTVYFLHDTDRVLGFDLELTNWPDITTKDEYLDFINQVVDGYVDLTKYEFTCKTSWNDEDYHCYDSEDFHKAADGEKISSYYFKYKMKNGEYDTNDYVSFHFDPEDHRIDARIHYSGYDYSKNEIVIKDEEIEYACNVIDQKAKSSRYSKDIAKDAELIGVHVLNGRTYLKLKVAVWDELTCDCGEDTKIFEYYLNYFIDYQLMQEQMTLEGKS